MRSIVLASLFLFSQNLYSQISTGRSAQSMGDFNLVSKVRSVTGTQYEAQQKNDSIVRGSLTKASADEYNYLEFDEKGRLANEKSVVNGFDTVVKQRIYKYDPKDSLLEMTVLNGDNIVVQKLQYTRDKKNRVTEVQFINNKGNVEKSFTQDYDNRKGTMEWIVRNEKKELNKYVSVPKEVVHYSKGNITQVDHYTFSNPTTMILATKSFFTYDRMNRLTEVVHTYKNDSTRQKTTCYYSSNSSAADSVKEWNYMFSGKLAKTVVYKYDANRNLIQKTITKPEENIIEDWTYKYTFDEKGNWIRQTSLLNKKPKTMVERKIVYQ